MQHEEEGWSLWKYSIKLALLLQNERYKAAFVNTGKCGRIQGTSKLWQQQVLSAAVLDTAKYANYF